MWRGLVALFLSRDNYLLDHQHTHPVMGCGQGKANKARAQECSQGSGILSHGLRLAQIFSHESLNADVGFPSVPLWLDSGYTPAQATEPKVGA